MIHHRLFDHGRFGEDAEAGRPLQFPMLELEFAQHSDPGQVREGMKIISATLRLPRRRPPIPSGGCSSWRMGSGVTIKGK